jgi:hypothetical protein
MVAVMRYYVFCESIDPHGEPYIIAEVVRDPGDSREVSIASALAGARAHVLSRTELCEVPDGRTALDRWDARDDTSFDTETRLLSRTVRRRAGVALRIVEQDEIVRRRADIRLPRDPVLRDVVLRSRGLRELTRALVQNVRAARVEHEEHEPTAEETDR